MTASVLKQDQNQKSFKKVIYYDTYTRYANVRGNPVRQATKRHLNEECFGETEGFDVYFLVMANMFLSVFVYLFVVFFSVFLFFFF